MKNAKPNRRKAVVLLALAATIALMSLQLARSARTVVGVVADADLSAEARVIDSFVNDLGKFDKKNSELSKKATLTRTQFDAHQREAESLKGRVSGVQNALREAIRKLKAAGQ
jgi:FtsZ-binding cell division protein ZapB